MEKMRKKLDRVISFTLAFLFLLAGVIVMPASANAAEFGNLILTKVGGSEPTSGIDYLYEDNTLKIIGEDEYIVSSSGSVFDGNIIISSAATITFRDLKVTTSIGSAVYVNSIGVKIKLEGSSNLAGSLRVPAGAEVTISGTGTLNVHGNAQSAGIGGEADENAGNIIISGGTVMATGISGGAGIGGGNGANGGNVVISGGYVTATGEFKNGAGGSGIGGGNGGSGGSVEIGGNADVRAIGSVYSAGIGGSNGGHGGNVQISGDSVVTAIGGADAAGIGGGVFGDGGDVQIFGNPVVNAEGGINAAGIGGGIYRAGRGGNGGNVTIAGGLVTAIGGNGGVVSTSGAGAGIGGGGNDFFDKDNTEGGNGGTVIISGGTVNAAGGENLIDEAKSAYDIGGGGPGDDMINEVWGDHGDSGTLTLNGTLTGRLDPSLTKLNLEKYGFGGNPYAESSLIRGTVVDDSVGLVRDNPNITGVYPSCTVIFESNGGTKIDKQTVVWGLKAKEPEIPEKEDYIFSGWYEDNTKFEDEWNFDNPITDDITLFAKWTEKTYKVTVETDGNGTADANVTIAPFKKEIVLSQTPNEGYIFKEWQVLSGGVTVTDNKFTMPREDAIVKAIYELDTRLVTFESNGGTLVTGQFVWYGTSVSKPIDPKKEGYIFAGWYKDNKTFENKWDFDTKITENIVLFAKWNAVEPAPTEVPTSSPVPTIPPTAKPTVTPYPTEEPTISPAPTEVPTSSPIPTIPPTAKPTDIPYPTEEPTHIPAPTVSPTIKPIPTSYPTSMPIPDTGDSGSSIVHGMLAVIALVIVFVLMKVRKFRKNSSY